MIRAVIADDHDIVLDGLVTRLKNLNVEIVKEATDGVKALEFTITLRPDLLLIDLSMPIMSGEEVLKALSSMNTKTKIVVITANDKASIALACLNNGAAGFLIKANLRHNLEQAIQKVMSGEIFVDESLRETVQQLQQVMGGNRTLKPVIAHDLSERELEVLHLLTLGSGNKRDELAAALGITNNTLNKHISSIKSKLNVETTNAAIQRAKELRVVR